jgi:hypothetical protein
MSDSRRQLWARRMGRYRASSLTVNEFCRREGVSVPAFTCGERSSRQRLPSPASFPSPCRKASLYHTSRKMKWELVGMDCRARLDFRKFDAKHWRRSLTAASPFQ